MADENCWRTPTFRQSVVQKIDEAIRTSGMATSRNSMEMESHVFQKARSKEEYLGFVARLILHVREMSTKKTGMNGPNQGGPGMPDPINALQNLASQGSRNSQMIGGMGTPPQGQQMGGSQQVGPQNATNLLQTLNRGPAPGMGNMPVGMQGNMSNTIQPNMAQMGGQMAGNIPVGMQGNMAVGIQPGGPTHNMQSGPGAMQPGMQQPLPNRSPMGGVGPGVQGGVNGGPTTMQQQQMQQQIQQQQQQQGNPNMMPSPLVNQLQNQQQVQQMQQQGQMQQGGGGFCGLPPGGGPMQVMQPMQSMQVGQGNQQQQMANQMMMNQQRKACDPSMTGQGQGNMMLVRPGSGMQQPGGATGGPSPGVVSNVFPMNATPTQFLVQSPTSSQPQQVQSPASAGAGGGVGGPPMSMPPTSVGGPQQQHQQMVPSPALAPSPGGAGGGMVMTPGQQGQRSVGGMAPSPSSSLNTPGQPGQSPMQDEQAYREKVRQLSKYIEPLRKMIARMGNEGEHMEKTSKMKKLLEILSNPSQRMPLETLLKCEVVLEKLDFKRGDGSISSTSGQLNIKEQHAFNPLIEAVSNCLQSNVINHTLHRTFGPTLEALFCPEIKLLPPLKRKRTSSPTPTSTISDVLQGEIARLDTRFKVSLDPAQQSHQSSTNNNSSAGGSKTVQLICWLDDKHLPCVPPVSLTVPEDYPLTSPKCHMAAHEYGATRFLSAVQAALTARIKKLPRYFSVSQLLDTWEMSVRQASAPNTVPVSATTLLMGL